VPEGARAELVWHWESWWSLGVRPLPAGTSVSSARFFCHLRVDQSTDGSREAQTHDGGLGVAAMEAQGP